MKRLSTFLLLLTGLGAEAQTSSPVTVQLQPFVSGMTRITDIVHCGDERVFCVLQPGTIRIAEPDGTVLPAPFLNITTQVNSNGNEQGLLGMAFHPDYVNNGYFYIYYTFGSGAGTSRVSRFSVSVGDPNVADPTSEVVLYTRAQPASNHNGGDLEFGPDGYLYVGFGDGGGSGDTQNNSQNLGNVLGTIIRIDMDGAAPFSVPEDNPFVDTPGAMPEIWVYGLRNPWRFGFDALTGDLWIGDVGQNAREEVDFWPAGDNSGPNFGWRCYEGNANYNLTGCQPASAYVFPVKDHVQSVQSWCSVIGGRVYRGEQFDRLMGRYLYTDYCGGQFYSLLPDGSEGWTSEQVLSTSMFGIACIGENSSLELFAGNSSNGQVYRIVDPCPMDAPLIAQEVDTLTSTPAATYAWYLNGAPIPNATEPTLVMTEVGTYAVLAGFGGGCQFVSAPIIITTLTNVAEASRSSITVHPVPAQDRLFFAGLPEGPVHIRVCDTQGRLVMVVAGRQAVSGGLDVSGLASGTYVLAVRDASGRELLNRPVIIGH